MGLGREVTASKMSTVTACRTSDPAPFDFHAAWSSRLGAGPILHSWSGFGPGGSGGDLDADGVEDILASSAATHETVGFSGLTFHHAYLVLGAGTVDYVSRPAPLALY